MKCHPLLEYEMLEYEKIAAMFIRTGDNLFFIISNVFTGGMFVVS